MCNVVLQGLLIRKKEKNVELLLREFLAFIIPNLNIKTKETKTRVLYFTEGAQC